MSTELDLFEAALGPLHAAHLSAGELRYRDQGDGIAVLFLAGLVLPGGFWRKVVPALSVAVRAIVPDLPLGAHSVPMRHDADLSPPAIADLLVELLDALGLSEVVVVGNDTGGAIAKMFATRHPERVRALVLTPCECYENFLPRVFRYLQVTAHIPGAVFPLTQSMRFGAVRRLPIAFGWLTKGPLDKAAYDAYLRPTLTDRGIRRDAAKVLRAIRRSQTMTADAALATFERPTLIVWSREDRVFPFEHAERLAATLPNATLIAVENSYTYLPEDQPLVLARHIDAFLAPMSATAP